jgi:hypothetical protein
MVLKDFECAACGGVFERIVDGNISFIAEYCEACKTTTNHRSICNGGTGKRYRFADWSGVDFSGQVKAMAPTATTLDHEGNVIADKHVSGKACQDMPRFSDDVREEKRDRITHRTNARRGKNKLYFTKGQHA